MSASRSKRSNQTSALRCLPVVVTALLGCGGEDKNECVPGPVAAPVSELTRIADDHYRVDTSIVVNRSAAQLWTTLTDFEQTPTWSSSFQGLSGDIREGGAVVATYIVQNPMTGEVGPVEFPHTLRYVEGTSFGWADPIAGLDGFSDDHTFLVERISDCQSRFIQSDAFRGTNPNVSAEQLAGLSAQGYSMFNQELKSETERREPMDAPQ